ncbi:MAG: hypothetical protein JHC61_07785 [Burkholderiaceae bacterium]|jgi:hypothetical protein|nr:hypothetical protein [Burkholderiaceae bacterium]
MPVLHRHREGLKIALPTARKLPDKLIASVLNRAGHKPPISSRALGLNSWPTGMLHDQEVNKILDIEGCNEPVVFFLGAGSGNSTPVRRDLLSISAANNLKKSSAARVLGGNYRSTGIPI